MLRDFFFGKTPERKEFFLYFQFTTVIFLIALAVGVFVAIISPGFAEAVFQVVRSGFSELSSLSSNIELFFFIFFHNLKIAGILFLSGFLFGALPIIIIFTNGFVIGLLMTKFTIEEGILLILSGTLPHGIFEIPAILLAGSLGLYFGVSLFKRLFTQKQVAIKKIFFFSMQKFIIIVVPFLLLSALIESFVTRHLLSFFS